MSRIYQKPPFNYQYVVGFENIVDGRDDPVSVVAPVTNGNLHLVTIPANTLVQALQSCFVRFLGTATAHGASAINLSVVLDGVTTFANCTLAANASPHGWRVELLLFRTPTPNQVVVFCDLRNNYSLNTATATLAVQGNRQVLSPFDFGVAHTVQVRATDNAGAETITQEFSGVTVQ